MDVHPSYLARPINVSSVRKLSVFRYPGGKTWFVPIAQDWLKHAAPKPKLYLEPFAGGGTVGLHVAANHWAEHVLLTEVDAHVSSVWNCCLCADAIKLVERILTFEVSQDGVQEILDGQPQGLVDEAFQTIVWNRMNYGGIMHRRARLVQRGESDRGLHQRWYADQLADRIMGIYEMRSKITFLQQDGIQTIEEHAADPTAVAFIDPPYLADHTGRRLYTHWSIDHDRLLDAASAMHGDFLLSYDNTPEALTLLGRYELSGCTVPMRTTLGREKFELVAGRELGWLRRTERGSPSFTDLY
jgi:DNA adenine methylase